MNRRYFAVFALAAALAVAAACTTTAPTNQNAAASPTPTTTAATGLPAELKPATDSINADDLMRHIKTLSRPTSSRAAAPARRARRRRSRTSPSSSSALGLKPGNPDGTFVQKVPLVGFRAEPEASIKAGGKEIDLRT